MIRYQLLELEKGIQGLVVMSTELEEVFICIFEARVPTSWEKVRNCVFFHEKKWYESNFFF